MKRQILYVEDHADTAELISFVLNQAGYEVVTASCIEAAYEHMRDGQFHLYLLDYHVPSNHGQGDALILCEKIRAQNKTIPIVFISGDASEEARQIALQSGATNYLYKPIEVMELHDYLESLLAEQAM